MNLAAPLAALFGWPLLILALGIYSITRLISIDSIIDRQRDWFYLRFPREGQTIKIGTDFPGRDRCQFIVTGDHYYVTVGHKLGELVSCPWCMGFWVSLALFGAFVFWPVTTTFVLVPLALRVIPGMIESVIH
jgi:hypothetical protein